MFLTYVEVSAYLGAMAASRKLSSILIIGPATMLQHWLTELSIWAPGLRRILIHKSGETDGTSRSITPSLLRNLDKWLRTARANRLNEAIDEEDYEDFDEDSFCGTGYAVVTTYENIRRSPDIWTGHNWSYVVMDEGQKVSDSCVSDCAWCNCSIGSALLSCSYTRFVILMRTSRLPAR